MTTSIKNKIKANPNDFSVSLKRFGACVGFCLGLFLIVAGIILSGVEWLEKSNFNKTEIALFISSFLLFGFGAHCLDLLEIERTAKRSNL